MPFIKEIFDAINLNPEYDENMEHCNKYGLSQPGVYLVNRMMDKNMLIEMDHMSPDAAIAVMDIVEVRQYSSVIPSHSWMNTAKDKGVHNTTKRLIKAVGYVAPCNVDANQMDGRVSGYLDEIEKKPYLAGVGLGTDMSGLGTQHGPRSNANIKPLQYLFNSEFGLVIDQQTSGNRVFDFNIGFQGRPWVSPKKTITL